MKKYLLLLIFSFSMYSTDTWADCSRALYYSNGAQSRLDRILSDISALEKRPNYSEELSEINNRYRIFVENGFSGTNEELALFFRQLSSDQDFLDNLNLSKELERAEESIKQFSQNVEIANAEATECFRRNSLESGGFPAFGSDRKNDEASNIRFQINRTLQEANTAIGSLSGLNATVKTINSNALAMHERLSYIKEHTAEFAVVEVAFATDRAVALQDIEKNKYWEFGNERGTEMYYGFADITIPLDRNLGELNIPKKKLLFIKETENRKKHITIDRITTISESEFFKAIHKKAESENQKGFLFVHGFNVSFKGGLLRTGQVKYDLQRDGPVILYSWSSKASPVHYVADRQTAEWSGSRLQRVIQKTLELDGVDELDILAHSMGARVFHFAAQNILRDGSLNTEKIKNIVMAAPDLDADVFRENIAPVFVDLSQSVTLYASSNDKAISTSRKINQYKILGDTTEGVFVYDGISSIDATDVKTSFLGHSFFGDSDSVVSDLYYLLRDVRTPRFGMTRDSKGFWRLVPKAR